MFDLLIERIVPVETGGDGMMLTLPELFSQLGRDTIDGFPGLAAHQAQAWYQFLAQLGALALHRGHLREPPEDPDAWRRLLADLTPSSAATAWSLMVENPTRPAFLQPPTGMLHKFKPAGETPDALDVLVTAKNHDRKRAQAIHGEPHLWLYALITLQTTQGYSGRGNPGIARMNGGLSSRVLVDRRPGPRWGPRVARAMRMLLVRRSEILRLVTDDLYQSEGGLALTWLHGWDTDEPLRIQELDPFFIEICRRVRLTATGKGRLAALARPAKISTGCRTGAERKSRRPMDTRQSEQECPFLIDGRRQRFQLPSGSTHPVRAKVEETPLTERHYRERTASTARFTWRSWCAVRARRKGCTSGLSLCLNRLRRICNSMRTNRGSPLAALSPRHGCTGR